jgi:hypothetical protein
MTRSSQHRLRQAPRGDGAREVQTLKTARRPRRGETAIRELLRPTRRKQPRSQPRGKTKSMRTK